MLGAFYAIAAPLLLEMEHVKERNEAKIEDILTKWIGAAGLPRKQKKKLRKDLASQYNIFIYARKFYDFETNF